METAVRWVSGAQSMMNLVARQDGRLKSVHRCMGEVVNICQESQVNLHMAAHQITPQIDVAAIPDLRRARVRHVNPVEVQFTARALLKPRAVLNVQYKRSQENSALSLQVNPLSMHAM